MEEHENCLDKKRVLEKAKEFDGSIKNMEDFFEHIKMLEECENCKRVFWNKLCPDCVNKNIEFEIKEYKKRVSDAIALCCKDCKMVFHLKNELEFIKE